MTISGDTCNPKKNSKQTHGHARVYENTRHRHVLLRLQMSLNVNGSLENRPLEKLPQMIFLCIVVFNCFQEIN